MSKTTIVADSSGLISLASATDQNHQKAIEIGQALSQENGTILIPNDVFSETLNVAGKKLGHLATIATAETLLSTSSFLIVDSNDKIRQYALNIFKKQPNSTSFTDCIVMATADSFDTKEIFGFEETFKKNGYLRLGVDN